jgi:hypothetical protein
VANSPYPVSFAYGGDTNFNGATGPSSLAVVDTTVPAVGALTATPGVLTPPNHKLVDILVSYTARDANGAPVCALTVSSNEPVDGTDDGNTSSDWTILDFTMCSFGRACGHGTGRTTRSPRRAGRLRQLTSSSMTVTVPK